MSGSVTTLTALLGSATGTSDSLLMAIYGGSGTTQTGAAAVQALANAERTQTQQVAATAKEPVVQRSIAAFTAAVTSAKDVNSLLSNKAAMDVLLTASGLSDQKDYTALAKAALTSDLNDPDSLVNKLTDTRWKTLAGTYNFAANGLSKLKQPAAISSIAEAYAKTVWEQEEDRNTPGLANALTFKSLAASVTSVDAILGNMTLRTVVTTTLGIPKQIAFQSLNAQEKAITDRLDISRLQDPKFVASFAQRYLIANAQNAADSSSSGTDLTALAVQAGGLLV